MLYTRQLEKPKELAPSLVRLATLFHGKFYELQQGPDRIQEGNVGFSLLKKHDMPISAIPRLVPPQKYGGTWEITQAMVTSFWRDIFSIVDRFNLIVINLFIDILVVKSQNRQEYERSHPARKHSQGQWTLTRYRDQKAV